MQGTGLAFLGMQLDIKGPTFAGDTIHVECEVIEARRSESRPGPRPGAHPQPRRQAGRHGGDGVHAAAHAQGARRGARMSAGAAAEVQPIRRRRRALHAKLATSAGPLAGVRVIDLTVNVLGPVATMILGDMGADVIKVETPEGDPNRQNGPARNANMAAMHLNMNRNKRSVTLNLKRPEAREALLRLVARTPTSSCTACVPRPPKRLGVALRGHRRAQPAHHLRLRLRLHARRPARERPGLRRRGPGRGRPGRPDAAIGRPRRATCPR